MKNNFSSSKKPKISFTALLLFFYVLWGNDAMAQQIIPAATATNDVFVWTGAVSSDWNNAGNWNVQSRATTGVAGTSLYPGEVDLDDWAWIPTGVTNAPIIKNTQTFQTARVYITNQVGAGATLTINIGGTLNVVNNASNTVVLGGGSIVNNGALIISSTGVGFASFPAYGIQCTTPNTLPAVATEYGVTGNGTMSIALTAANFAGAGAIAVTGNSGTTTTPTDSANVTYRIDVNNTTITLNLASAATIAAIRTVGGNNANKLIIGGTGFTIGSDVSPVVKPQLVNFGAGSSLTVDSGTTLTHYSAATNAAAVISTFASGSAYITNLTNNGTINILGASTRSGLNFSTGTPNTARQIYRLTNNGTFNVNLNISGGATYAPISTSDGGGSKPDNIFNLVNTGNMSLTNTGGSALYASQSYNSPPLVVTNSGTLNLNGTTFSGSPTFVNNPNIKGYINNSGLLTSNNELANVVFTNSSAGTIAFTNAAAGATTSALVTGTFDINNGKIQTGSAKLNNLGLIAAYGATSVVEPGGTGKGIADFNKTGTAVVLGKLVLQVAGNTTAGTDYDQITNSFAAGGFDVTGATLDVTEITGTATPVDIITTNAGTITGPFATVTGLTAGWKVDYTTLGKVQLIYDSGYVSPTVDYVWNGSASTAWITAANWTPSGLPDQNSAVTIVAVTNQPTISTDASIKSLTIDSGATLTVTGPNLTVKGAVTNNGTMTLASNSNLVQIDNVANTGAVTVNRNSNALSRLDYTLWSSPVTNASWFLTNFSPATDPDRFYTYNEGTNLYNAIISPALPDATPFASATGYLIRMPNDAVTAPAKQTFAGIFIGVPNNGDISKTLLNTANGYNAIGNPYPSTIDAQAFITANTANIESSLYFWRKINAAAGSAYAVYNPMGSTSATPSSALPNGNIQVGQGFFVKAKTGATTVSFNNAMRVANNQNQFFKTKSVVDKNRVWLNLTNTGGAFSQVLVGYTTDAIQGIDIFDAKYFNDSSIALTSNINNEEYTIQGRPTFDASDVVALNFKTDTAGDYTIALDHFDGLFTTGQDIYLKDNNTGTETDLKTADYNFTAVAGVDNTRFSLKYQKTLKVDAPAFNENSVRVYKNNGTLYVNSGNIAINNIKVFDIQGRLIIEQKNVKANSTTIKDLKATNQVFIVKIVGEDNNIVTKKVLN